MIQCAPGKLRNEVREIPDISGAEVLPAGHQALAGSYRPEQDSFQGQPAIRHTEPKASNLESLQIPRGPHCRWGGHRIDRNVVSKEVPVAFVPLWRSAPGYPG